MKKIYFINEAGDAIARSGRWPLLQDKTDAELRVKRGRFEPDAPPYDPATQYVGPIDIKDGELFFPVIDYTPDELAGLFEQTKQGYIFAVQSHLDTEAAARGYDNIFTAVTYADDPDPVFDAEGKEARKWRSAVWKHCHKLLADVEAGKVAPPTVEELIEQLPAVNWP